MVANVSYTPKQSHTGPMTAVVKSQIQTKDKTAAYCSFIIGNLGGKNNFSASQKEQ